MQATEILMAEHRVIEKVLSGIERELERLRNGGPLEAGFFEKAVDFIRNFADGSHHAKEESELFPVLEERGVPKDGGPVGCMLQEHEQGRDYVKNLCTALEEARADPTTAAVALIRNAGGYVALLRDHIYKEDNILYPTGDSVMTEEDQTRLTAVFDRIDHEFVATGEAEKYRRLADELAGE